MTETHYCWMDPAAFPGRLIIPRSNPDIYAQQADLLFDSPHEARQWQEDEIRAASYATDEAEVAYIESWVLCRRTLETVDPAEPKIQGESPPALPIRHVAETEPIVWLDAVNKWLDWCQAQPLSSLKAARLTGVEINGALERVCELHPNTPGLMVTLNRTLKVLFDIELEGQ